MEFTEEKLIYGIASREASAHSKRSTGVEKFFQISGKASVWVVVLLIEMGNTGQEWVLLL